MALFLEACNTLEIGSDVEIDVWATSAHVHKAELATVIAAALEGYKRPKGHNPMTLLCESRVGPEGFQALLVALLSGVHEWDGRLENGCLQIRQDLRIHLGQYLQKKLIQDGRASSVIQDAFFSADLGL